MLTFTTAPLRVKGYTAIDITRKSGKEGLAFAPSWKLLGPAIEKRRQGALTAADHQAYRKAYLEEMRQSWATQRPAWEELLRRERAVLTCYCTRPEHASHCHRVILAWLLCQLGACYKGEMRDADHVAVAIIGGRERTDLDCVRSYVQRLGRGSIVVHGGSPGLEQAAAEAAEARGLQHLMLPLTGTMVKRWGLERAQHQRDLWIAQASDCIALFPGGEAQAQRIDQLARRTGRLMQAIQGSG